MENIFVNVLLIFLATFLSSIISIAIGYGLSYPILLLIEYVFEQRSIVISDLRYYAMNWNGLSLYVYLNMLINTIITMSFMMFLIVILYGIKKIISREFKKRKKENTATN